VRTLRTDRFRYTRNYKLDRVFLQPQYRDTQEYTKNLRELYANGELPQKLKDIYFGERSAEELYDLDSDPHQLDNLVGNSKFSKVLEEHRLLLEDWVSKGDMGAVEESDAEMLFQTKGPAKWRVVNPEYEVVREDSDGDGLSDDWEGYNDRDPNDGKLLFTFDCGGWQTEGWEGNPGLPNIAGYQGFLDFELPNGEGSIVKSGLNADLAKQGGVFSIDMRVSESALVWLSFNSGDGVTRKLPGPVALSASGEFETLKFQLPKSGLVKTLRVDFSSDPGAFVEIDSMKAL
jgi:N-sulfoglucosamine sulfohydrolase